VLEALHVFLEGLGVGHEGLRGCCGLLSKGLLLLGVDELTAGAVLAVELLVELGAGPRLVHGGHVLLLLELVLAVGEGAVGAVSAGLGGEPAAAELGLYLELVVLGYDPAVALEGEGVGLAGGVVQHGPHELAGLATVLEDLVLEGDLLLDAA